MDKSDGLWNDQDMIHLLLQEIKVEKQSIGTWMGMYHSSQSFLFAAFAISSLGQHRYHQAIHWFCDYIVPVIGILFSFFMSIVLSEGRARVSNLYGCLGNRLSRLGGGTSTECIAGELCLPSTNSRRRGSLYSKWVPVICGLAWAYVAMHSAWYEFVNKQPIAHHSSSAGNAGTGEMVHEDDE